MPAGATLSELLDMLKAEAGLSLNAAHGVAQRDAHIYLLNRVQRELYVTHDWPSLKVTRTIALNAGQRLYELPADMDMEGVNEVYVTNGAQYEKLTWGVEPEDLNTYNADPSFQTWPPLKWYIDPDNTRSFEVWPVPSQAGTLTFRGRKALRKMVEDTDICVLDDNLIALFAAAEILAKVKAEDAQIKLQKAQNLLRHLKARQGSAKETPFVIGGGDTGLVETRRLRAGIDYIPIKGA